MCVGIIQSVEGLKENNKAEEGYISSFLSWDIHFLLPSQSPWFLVLRPQEGSEAFGLRMNCIAGFLFSSLQMADPGMSQPP